MQDMNDPLEEGAHTPPEPQEVATLRPHPSATPDHDGAPMVGAWVDDEHPAADGADAMDRYISLPAAHVLVREVHVDVADPVAQGPAQALLVEKLTDGSAQLNLPPQLQEEHEGAGAVRLLPPSNTAAVPEGHGGADAVP
jgi:hypothetical protein